jgi:hypothetical protein
MKPVHLLFLSVLVEVLWTQLVQAAAAAVVVLPCTEQFHTVCRGFGDTDL